MKIFKRKNNNTYKEYKVIKVLNLYNGEYEIYDNCILDELGLHNLNMYGFEPIEIIELN